MKYLLHLKSCKYCLYTNNCTIIASTRYSNSSAHITNQVYLNSYQSIMNNNKKKYIMKKVHGDTHDRQADKRSSGSSKIARKTTSKVDNMKRRQNIKFGQLNVRDIYTNCELMNHIETCKLYYFGHVMR